MKSKTSFFSGGVFRADWKRFWWLSALHFIFLLVSSVMPFFMDIHSSSVSASGFFLSSFLFHKSGPAFAVQWILPVGVCVLLFSYLHNASASASLHGTPLRRTTLYISHCAAGLSLLAAPVVLCGLVLLCSLASPQIAFALSLRHIGGWVTVQLVYSLLFFSLAAFTGMFTGNIIAHLLFPYIFAGLPMFFWIMGYRLITSHLYGLHSFSSSWRMAFLYQTPFRLLRNTYAIPMYLGISALLLAGGYLAYKFRPLENAGEIIVFSWLRPVFTFGAALCAGLVGYFYARHFWQMNSIPVLLVFGLPGLLAAHMLSRRALSLRGFLKPCLIFSAFVLALFCVFRFDLTGYERRIPKQKDIIGVSIAWPTETNQARISINGRWATETQPYNPLMTDPMDIQNVIALHKHKLKNRSTSDNNNDSVAIPISYHLRNGRILRRFYYLSATADQAYLEPVWNAEKVKKSWFPLLDETEKTILQITVIDKRMPRLGKNTYSNAQQRLLDALKQDLYASTQFPSLSYNQALTSVDIQYTKPMTFTDTGDPVDSRNLVMFGKRSMHIPVLPTYQNTIALLKELGFYNSLPGPENISTIIARLPKSISPADTQIVSFTDPAEIAELYSYIGSIYLTGTAQTADQWITLDFDTGINSYRCEIPVTDSLPALLTESAA